MSKKKKKQKYVWESSSDFIALHKQLAFLRKNKRKIQEDHELYFNEVQNCIDIEDYYKLIPQALEGLDLFYEYHGLLNQSHNNPTPYFISKDLYLYTWVDLHPDGSVKSIYSDERKSPESLIMEDYEIISQKYDEFQEFLQKVKRNEFESLKQLKAVERRLKLNTEHIVPQSWFGALEPMKGDLHHLFVCDPECNIARSNFPYADFTFYQPESPDEPIRNYCGIAANDRFEPEHGKGAAARAMMYFLIRYPKVIKKEFWVQIDIPLLISWHTEFPVSLYEKHRNQMIFRIQGNRNPFIDLPDLAKKIIFPLK